MNRICGTYMILSGMTRRRGISPLLRANLFFMPVCYLGYPAIKSKRNLDQYVPVGHHFENHASAFSHRVLAEISYPHGSLVPSFGIFFAYSLLCIYPWTRTAITHLKTGRKSSYSRILENFRRKIS